MARTAARETPTASDLYEKYRPPGIWGFLAAQVPFVKLIEYIGKEFPLENCSFVRNPFSRETAPDGGVKTCESDGLYDKMALFSLEGIRVMAGTVLLSAVAMNHNWETAAITIGANFLIGCGINSMDRDYNASARTQIHIAADRRIIQP